MQRNRRTQTLLNGWVTINSVIWCSRLLGLAKEMAKAVTGRLNNGLPQIPPAKLPSELTLFQQSLPVYQMKDVITKAINDNRVLMISGETGSGKTTQACWSYLLLSDKTVCTYYLRRQSWGGVCDHWCLSVCLSVHRISQTVIDRFEWNYVEGSTLGQRRND